MIDHDRIRAVRERRLADAERDGDTARVERINARIAADEKVAAKAEKAEAKAAAKADAALPEVDTAKTPKKEST